ncbi:MerR family transcriptional regulator [Actinosynnema sp. ALI-1.44]|uniref:helix-turn-helix domain-containing protein n=1 Tax=Actinosynnema sp. ALI-1.44 TaxID=1933779 RepID=UPI00097BBE1A|nr:MerR family transcriptional regulator [Actinosynnema sp. ALI-1.44]ONI74668.1 MerR family transcriptional regulator [Actinosynnema sp. ALI-1.44]
MSELWTIEQLPDQVAELLSENYDGQRNGRIRELPNRRTIRWYTTIGLVDRPAATRGRTVLYGRRHLLQIVAVKKLQSTGASLAEIQEQLVGATDSRLAELAGVAHVDAVRPQVDVGTSPQFWKGHAHGRPTVAPPVTPTQTPGNGETAPNAVTGADTVTHIDAVTVPKLVHGVRLADSVTVVLEAAAHMPDADEIAAIEAAAAPLLELLGRLGLAPSTGGETQ